MKRKSPVKHRVKRHTRKGKPVTSYDRGHGTHPASMKVTKRKITKTIQTGPKAYVVNFTYEDGTGETVPVIATSYKAAMAEAFEEKKDKRTPTELEIIDPLLGNLVHALHTSASKIGHMGGKFIVRGAKLTRVVAIKAAKHGKVLTRKGLRMSAKYGLKGAKWSVRRAEITSLLVQAFSKHDIISAPAKATLLRKYPDVYHHTSFSRPRTSKAHKARVKKIRENQFSYLFN